MNITFFIGNGFDLNLGLETRYTDFFPYFSDNAKDTNMIKAWLKEAEESEDSLAQWSDLEKKLGEELSKVTLDSRNQFMNDIAELNILLSQYLGDQQKNFLLEGREQEIFDELARSLLNFRDDLASDEKDSIGETQNKYAAENYIYQFVCFNYTDTLDKILGVSKQNKTVIAKHNMPHSSSTKENSLGDILHIHGTITEEMILGVNDIDQIFNSFLKDDTEFLDTFIKSRMNDRLAQGKTKRAKKIISQSHIIVIFGMSLGITDKMWWEEIVAWLKKTPDNKLVIYNKSSDVDLDSRLPVLFVPKINQIIDDLLKKGGIDSKDPDYENLKGRIFITYKCSIFKFKEIDVD